MSSTIEKLGYLAGAAHFRRISEKLYVDRDQVYKDAGLHFKASWFPVYYVLALSESPLTILQIAQQIDFSHITVKNVLRELEAAEYVSIEINPADKRSKLVSLSTKGQTNMRKTTSPLLTTAKVPANSLSHRNIT